MAKHRLGLHKNITAIFGGVPLSSESDTEQSSFVPGPKITQTPHSSYSDQCNKSLIPVNDPIQTFAEKQQYPKIAKLEKTPTNLPKQTPTWKKKKILLKPHPFFANKKQKLYLLLTLALSVILIFIIVRNLHAPAGGNPEYIELSQLQSSTADLYNRQTNWQIPPVYPRNLRDPMRLSHSTSDITASEGTVRGIIISDEQRYAIIDKKIVKEGDKIAGATVVKINSDSVEFEMNGKKYQKKILRNQSNY